MLSMLTRNPAAQRLALVVAIAAFVVLMFGVSFASMWELWQTSDHRHGLLVVPISAFLIWRLRHQLVDLPATPDARGLLLVAALAMAWLVARLAGIQFLEHVAVLAMVPATVATLAGPKIAHRLLFPLLFLLLAAPLGESLVPFLMVVTADISTGLLKLSGIPLLRSGQYISLPGGEFVVADVCAGLRYLVSGIMISLLYGYLTYSGFRKRLVLVAVTAATMIVTNGIRAYIVMAIASATRMQYFGGRDHIYFGWLMFGVVIMLIMWIGARFADDQEHDDANLSEESATRASHSILPLIAALGMVMLVVTLVPLQSDFGEHGAMIAAALALLAFVFLLVRHSSANKRLRSDSSASAVPKFGWGNFLTGVSTVLILIVVPRIAGSIENRAVEYVSVIDLESLVPCEHAGPWKNSWQPRFKNADLERSATFTCSGESVSIYVASYASALQGKELISSSHQVVPARWDRASTTSSQAIQRREGGDFRVRETQVNAADYMAVVWYWYEIDDRVAAGSLKAKAYQVLALMRGRPAGGRVVVIETPLDRDLQRTRERLESVARNMVGTGSNTRPVDVD